MAVIRQLNMLGQMRFDIPHLRLLESSIAYDFDVLAGDVLSGGRALVVHGFEVITATVGSPVTSMVIRTASGALLHPEASESGTIFKVPGDRADEILSSANPRISGSFTANTTNYVGIDLRRSADATTADVVQFLDPNTNKEKPKTVPLGRVLDYVFVVSTQDFDTTPGIAPLAKVVTDSYNNITSVEDARYMLGRLGSGGGVPDVQYAYPWPGGRGEIGDNTDFTAGDKAIGSLKEWMDATMTRLWELGGGEHWYSSTADRNVKMLRSGAAFTNGEWFEWDGTHLHWKNLSFLFDNSTGVVNEVKNQTSDSAGLTDLADGECIYVDVDRTQNKTGGSALQAVKASLTTLSYPTVPGSRFVIAWRKGSDVFTRDTSYPVGASFQFASTTAYGIVVISHADTSGPNSGPTVMSKAGDGAANGFVGLDANKAASIDVHLTAATVGLTILTATGQIGLSSGGGGTDGVLGYTTVSSGTSYGVHGRGDSTSNTATSVSAVYGECLGGGVGGRFISAKGPGLVAQGGDGTSALLGFGIIGTGGPGYAGVKGIGGTTTGIGIRGEGTGTGAGGTFQGGSSAGQGVIATGGASGGTGGEFHGGSSGGHGVYGYAGAGGAGGNGVRGVGGDSDAAGVYGEGGENNGPGVEGMGTGTGPGGKFTGGSTTAINSVGNVSLTGSNPATSDSFQNMLTPANLIKAWGKIDTTTPSISFGFNLTSTANSSANAIEVVMASAMASSNYIVLFSPYGSSPRDIAFSFIPGDSAGANGTTTFRIYATRMSDGGAVDLQTNNYELVFVVLGLQ